MPVLPKIRRVPKGAARSAPSLQMQRSSLPCNFDEASEPKKKGDGDGDGGNNNGGRQARSGDFQDCKKHAKIALLPNAELPNSRRPVPGKSCSLTIKSEVDASLTISSEPLLTLPDVAELLQLSRTSIYRLIANRKIPFIKAGGVVRFLKADLEEYISHSRIAPII